VSTGRRFLVACAASLAACGNKTATPTNDAGATSAIDGGVSTTRPLLLDWSAHPDACIVGHEGVLLDLGAPAAHALYGIRETSALESTEHDGATWDRVSTHTLTFHFAGPVAGASDVDRAEAYVDIRIRGLAARRFSIALNGKQVGGAALTKNQTDVRSFHASTAQLTNGTNELVVHFGGLGKAPDAAAEIDWIRVGAEADPAYAAPTYDSIATETLQGVPRRALALRAPAFVRCAIALPENATFDAQVGLLGKGSGDVEVRALRDRAAPVSLGKIHVDDASGWKSISVAVPRDGAFAIEARVDQATQGARVLLAEAKIRAPERAKKPRAGAHDGAARNVVLVVLGQTEASAAQLPALSAIAQTGRTFDANRATSTWAAASFASMLTGVLPIEHGDLGDASALATSPITIGEAAREAGVSTALFTANPTTSAAFGFGRGFQTFQSFFPADPGGAVRVFDEASTWIGAHKSERFLLVIHARGGHPPWEVPADQLKSLEPENYTGPIEPGAHAAEILSHARHVPPLVRFNDADRKRAWALHAYALSAHDAALAKLESALDEAGVKSQTSVIVTGDVNVATGARVPFGDAERDSAGAVDETALATLLVVHSAGESVASHVRAPTSSIDVATTVLGELGLAPPQSFEGEDLQDAPSDDGSRPIFSQIGSRQVVSWMGLLAKTDATQTELCVPALDAACASDASPFMPIASEAVRKLLADSAKKPAARAAPSIDGPTAAALTAWGR